MKRLTNKRDDAGPARLALLAAALLTPAETISGAADRTLTALPPLAVTLPASKRTGSAGGDS